MKIVHITSLIARLAFMATMVLGLLFWIAQIRGLHMLLTILIQLRITSIHELLGLVGTLSFLVLSVVAVWARGTRLLGAGSLFYALLVPAFGLTQPLILVGNLHWLIQVAHLLVGIGAMYLARGIERRYQHLNLERNRNARSEDSNLASYRVTS